jgi:hypothetical protein
MGKSVMSSVRTPKRRAMSAWPNSWSTTEVKIASISNVLRSIAVAPWPATSQEGDQKEKGAVDVHVDAGDRDELPRPPERRRAVPWGLASRALLTGRLHGLFLDSGGCFDLSVTTILRSPLLHCLGDVDPPTD